MALPEMQPLDSPSTSSSATTATQIISPRKPLASEERSDLDKRDRRMPTSLDHAAADTSGDTSLTASSMKRAVTNEKTLKSKPMPSDELLAMIIEMRLAGQSVARARAGSAEAGKTIVKSSMDTLDVSTMRLQDLPTEMIEVIRDEVERLALATNYIHTLPDNLPTMTRLRYLNVASNLITDFPEVLTQMPALVILDISRNKLRKLPPDPGNLLNLRVLSLSNNRIRRLPTWILHMRNLRTLKIEANPIQWPPPHISIEPPTSIDSYMDEKEKGKAVQRENQLWVTRMKRWMKENLAKEDERTRRMLQEQQSGDVIASSSSVKGHAKGQSSATSDSSISIRHNASEGQQSSEPSASGFHSEAETRSVNHSLETSFADSFAEQSGVNEADSSTSTMPIATPAGGSSPERSFRMRPLVLTRVASGRGGQRSASAGSPSSKIISTVEKATSIAGQSASDNSAMEHLSLSMARGQAHAQAIQGSTEVLSVSAQIELYSPTEPFPSSASQSSIYSVESADESIQRISVAGLADSLSPLPYSSPSRNTTPTHENVLVVSDPATPTPELAPSMTAAPKARVQAGSIVVDGFTAQSKVSDHRAAGGELAWIADNKVRHTSTAPRHRPPSGNHGRTQSHSSGQQVVTTDSRGVGIGSSVRDKALTSKQSLPDLRPERLAASSMSRDVSLPSSSSSAHVISSSNSGTDLIDSSWMATSSARAMASSTSMEDIEVAIPMRRRQGGVGTPVAPSSSITTSDGHFETFATAPRSNSDILKSDDHPDAENDSAINVTPKAAVSLNRAVSVRRAALLDAAGLLKDGTASPVTTPRTPTKTASIVSGHQQHERDSYFKRLSTFPSTLVASACSTSVLTVIDASRGILFALSQIFTALKQYILFCTDERICAQIQRILDVAAGTLAILIDNLDRFDSLALKGQNPAQSIVGVMDASRESVLTFRQVVSVLQLQLSSLLKSADLRYTRSLMVMLYGAMVEVSTSWKELSDQDDDEAVVEVCGVQSQPAFRTRLPPYTHAVALSNGLGTSHLPSIAESVSPQSAGAAGSPASAQSTTNHARAHRKRQGGSFSAQDVKAGSSIAMVNPSSSTASSIFTMGQSSSVSGNHADWQPDTPSRQRGGVNRRDGLLVGSAGLPNTQVFALASTTNRYPPMPDQREQTYTLPPPAGVPISAPAGRSAFPIGEQSDDHAADTSVAAAFPGHSETQASYSRPPTIDHHLLSLIQQVISTAFGVWTTLFEHLASLGIRGQAAASVNGVFSPETTPILGPNRIGGAKRGGLGKGQASSSSGVGSSSGGELLKPLRDERSARSVSPSPSVTNNGDASTAAPHPHSQSALQLNLLREQCLNAAHLTKRLQHTLEKVQDEVDNQGAVLSTPSGMPVAKGDNASASLSSSRTAAISASLNPAESRRLIEESIAFVRVVTSLLIQVKTLSISHDTLTAPELRRVLTALATGCTNLGVHLTFCAPTGSAVYTTGPTKNAPVHVRGGATSGGNQ